MFYSTRVIFRSYSQLFCIVCSVQLLGIMIATVALGLARLDPASLASHHHQLSPMNLNSDADGRVRQVIVLAKVLLGMNL